MSCKPCVLGTHLEDKRLGLKFREEGIESVLAFYRASILTTWLLYGKERLSISFFSCVLKEKYEYCLKRLGPCFQQGMLAKDLKFSERTETQSRLIFSGLTCCWVPVDSLKEHPCSACWLLQSQCARVNPPLGCTEDLTKEVGALVHKILDSTQWTRTLEDSHCSTEPSDATQHPDCHFSYSWEYVSELGLSAFFVWFWVWVWFF